VTAEVAGAGTTARSDKRLVIIANARSGVRRLRRAERVLREHGVEYRIVRTTGPGHAVEAARDALRGGVRCLVAAGGDGTVHEVANAILAEGAGDALLGVLPIGSGCDFVRTFGIPRDAGKAARRLAAGTVRVIDVGKVTFGTGAIRYFVNIAEAGLGGAVVARAARLPAVLGPSRYLAALWLVLPGFRRASVRFGADGESADGEQAGHALNIVVANCRYYGGGMQISPDSAPDDGILDVLIVSGPKSAAFTTMPKIYLGRQLPHRYITTQRVSELRVEAEPSFVIEADGEVLGSTPATFEIIPGALRLMA
jgi:diacylglycerol kinase (ATP)